MQRRKIQKIQQVSGIGISGTAGAISSNLVCKVLVYEDIKNTKLDLIQRGAKFTSFKTL